MRKIFTLFAMMWVGITFANASVVIDGTEYVTDTISVKEVGPGIVHVKYRIPDYPLNINTLTVDMTQGYNRVELTTGGDSLGRTERLADAYVRHKAEGKYPIAGANASFWCVASNTDSPYVLGTPYGGSIYNGKIVTETNMYANQWQGVGQSGQIGVDKNNRVWVDWFTYKGYIKSAKWSSVPEIHQVNRMCNAGEVLLCNSFFGENRKFRKNVFADDYVVVYCNLAENETWEHNKDIKSIVAKVEVGGDESTLGEYDFALVGTGANIDLFNQLTAGDEIAISYTWTNWKTGEVPDFENFVEGESLVLRDGEITSLNNKSYPAMVYSRTAYGTTADGNTMFIIVIDKSSNEYGVSAGCPTTVVCQILQQMGCSNLVSMDAGGSAQMMVEGAIVNTTTEGTPRSVGNGMFVYSTAPRSSEIARIEFVDFRLEMPVNSVYTPKMRGYNQYGDLVDDDLQGVTFTCEEQLGTCEGSIIRAGSTPAYGVVTAHYNGITQTKAMQTITAPVSIRIKPTILIDNAREYPIEVISEVGRKTYMYDPAVLEWVVEDETVAVVENGVLRGLKEGETKISCELYGNMDETTVKVEIAPTPTMNTDWSNWTFKGSGAKNFAIDENGVFTFDYTGGRGAYVQMNNTVPFYSLPDKIRMEFNSTLPITEVKVDLRGPTVVDPLYIVENNNGNKYAVGETYTIEFDLAQVGDMNDLINFPLTLHSVRLGIPTSGETKEQKVVNITKLEAEYKNYNSVETVDLLGKSGINVFPNPVTDGYITVGAHSDKTNVKIYSLAGVLLVDSDVTTAGGSATLNVESLPSGVYMLRAVSDTESRVTKIIVK